MLRGMDRGMSAWEEVNVSHMAAKRPSRTAIAGLTIGSVGLLAGISAWVFGGVYANARSKGAEALIAANSAHAQQIETLLANRIAENHAEFVHEAERQSDINLHVSQQQENNNMATASAMSQAEANLMMGLMTGQYQACPQKVALYQPAMPCSCPNA